MKERPILFQGAMVRALLAGTKTQTRRIVKGERASRGMESGWHLKPYGFLNDRQFAAAACPYGQPGDRLWVRETWGVGTRPCPHEGWYDGIEYRADEVYLEDGEYLHLHRVNVPEGKDLDDYRGGWKPSIHMPRWASRLTLDITAVRVERLQDISEADAVAEGVETMPEHDRDMRPTGRTLGLMKWPGDEAYWDTPRNAYAALWEQINGPGSWDANPWVWVVEFRRAAAAIGEKMG